jgi:hypothetical protein
MLEQFDFQRREILHSARLALGYESRTQKEENLLKSWAGLSDRPF